MPLKLYQLILKAKKKDAIALDTIIQVFSKQMNAYSRRLDQEDTLQDLTIFLIELIAKLCLDKEYLKNDKILLAYISKSLKHRYFKLAKKSATKIFKEVDLQETLQIPYHDNTEQEFFMHDLFMHLNSKEKDILTMIYIYGFSVKEISFINNVTRQAINQTKNRALHKLKLVI